MVLPYGAPLLEYLAFKNRNITAEVSSKVTFRIIIKFDHFRFRRSDNRNGELHPLYGIYKTNIKRTIPTL